MTEHPGNDRRFPRSVFGVGVDPDPRFSLANERTFLAWIRTSVALIAGGVALEVFDVPMHPTLRLVTALVLIIAGIGAPIQAWVGWMRAERALRLGHPLPPAWLAAPVAAAVAIAGVLVVTGLLLWQ